MSNEQFRLRPSETALLVMDFQNATIGEGDGAKHAESQNVVANVSRLITEARSLSVPVIHVHLVIEPKEGDFVVEKMRMNPFLGTSLEPLLRGLGVNALILTGAYTNVVVEHTARHAADLGFDVVVASDGTSSINDEWHRGSTDFTLTLVAKVVTCGEIVDALHAAPNARDEKKSTVRFQ